MAYERIVFDGEALFSDAPREELEALGAACTVGAAQRGALFVSAKPEAVNAAFDAGLDCALALWRGVPARHARATHYLREPYDLVTLLTRRERPYDGLEWMRTAVEMQFIAQAGLAYSKDPYDLERFARLREMAAQMLARGSGLPEKTVRDVFLCETGYQTPKIDTRAAIVEDGRILLVQENTGLWALPGGWMDVDTTISQNTAKEAFEEAGLEVLPRRLIALQEHNLHNPPTLAIGIVKVFVLCERLSGTFHANIETTRSGFFTPDNLPPLAESKTTPAQVRMCLAAAADEHWRPLFD